MRHLEYYAHGYDNANELTGVTENGSPVGTYTYDSNGNQTGTGYSTGTENEQTASPGLHLHLRQRRQPDQPDEHLVACGHDIHL